MRETTTHERMRRHDELFTEACKLVEPHLILQDRARGAAPAAGTKTERDLRRALELFRHVLVLSPGNWPAVWTCGKIHECFGDWETAYPFFSRAFELEKKNPEVPRALALACLQTGRVKEAVTVSEHAVRVSPSDAGLRANLALAYICAGDIASANQTIDGAHADDPGDIVTAELRQKIHEVRAGKRPVPKCPADLRVP